VRLLDARSLDVLTRYAEGEAIASIAATHDLTEGAARTVLHRARTAGLSEGVRAPLRLLLRPSPWPRRCSSCAHSCLSRWGRRQVSGHHLPGTGSHWRQPTVRRHSPSQPAPHWS
jgi:hypothetical protein